SRKAVRGYENVPCVINHLVRDPSPSVRLGMTLRTVVEVMRDSTPALYSRCLTQLPQSRKCSRTPLHRAAASPLQQSRKLSGLSALNMFLRASGQDAFCSDPDAKRRS